MITRKDTLDIEDIKSQEERYKKLDELILLSEVDGTELKWNRKLPPIIFIAEFFQKFNKSHKTYIVSQGDSKPFCLAGKRRSVGDLYRIMLRWYPDMSLLQLMGMLYNIVENSSRPEISLVTSICPNVKSRVYWPRSENGTSGQWSFSNPHYYNSSMEVGGKMDEFGYTVPALVAHFGKTVKEQK